MSIKDLTSTEIASLVGTRHAQTGVEYAEAGRQPWHEWIMRSIHHLSEGAEGLDVRADSTAMYVTVTPGRAVIDDVVLVYAGATVNLSSYNNDTAYLWLYDSGGGVAAVGAGTDAAGWPTTTSHIKLAEVTLSAGAVTTIVDRREESAWRKLAVIWPMQTGGLWAIDGDGARTNGGGMVGDVTLSQATALYAKVYDAGTAAYEELSTSNTSAEYAADYQLFPDAEAVNDAVYFGHTVPFCELAIDIGTAGVYSGDALAWEYWNGSAWTALTLEADRTDTTAGNGLRSFQQDGAIHFIPPSTWAATTVDGQSAYWIRARVTAGNLTTIPISDSKEHEIVTPDDGFVCPHAALITAIRATDLAATLHAANAVKFILMNFTSGVATAELTWAISKQNDRWTAVNLVVAKGDVLGVLVTQEDGTNEVNNAQLELAAITRT